MSYRAIALVCLLIFGYSGSGICGEPLGAGFQLTDFKDPLGDGPMKVAIFYPTTTLHGNSIVGDWTIDAERDAPLAQGQYPLIAVSHGYGGNRLSLFDFATYLARQDFIVVAVTHPGDDLQHFAKWRSDRVLVGREYDVRAALDTIIADPVFGPHIDRERIGVAGFSMGGYTALLLVGAVPDFARFIPYCREQLDETCKTDQDPPKIRPGLVFFKDSRIKSAFLMAPGPGYFFERSGMEDITAPIYISDPAADQVLTRPYSADRIRDLLPHPPIYERLNGVGHFIYSPPPCPASVAQVAPEICNDPPGVDRAAVHAQLAGVMANFFSNTMR
jgi:predicted dienelactone hydrolase